MYGIRRRILHLDMDAFFASVEQMDDPTLKGKPVIVGGGARGVVSAASYEARKFGVRSAMPTAVARRLCPQGAFVPVRGRRYAEVSNQVMEAVAAFSPLMEQTSVDEAYLDVTGTERLHGTSLELARSLKRAVAEATGGLTCSVGIAPNRYLAKICSDLDKPDGITILEDEAVPAFLETLPVGKISGFGPRLCEALAQLRVKHAAEICRFSREFWAERMGEKTAAFLWSRGRGIDDRPLVPVHEAKSSGSETTFETDTDDQEFLIGWLYHHSERIAADLRRMKRYGRTVTLKLRYADFTTLSRSVSLRGPVNTTRPIHEAALSLLAAQDLRRKVRLIGVSVSNLSHGERALGLFGEEEGKREEKLEETMDAIKSKFGRGALVRGRLFGFRK